ncbi:MAG: TolC family protein, partial [Acidobacteriaceae bacterium]|nr:TolC family protein [Acidobacteriaceae bacterium]
MKTVISGVRWIARSVILAFSLVPVALTQTSPNQLSATGAQANSSVAPVTLTLQDALERAKKINPEYRAAVTEFGLAKEDKVQSRAALLPNVNFNNSFVYTEGSGIPGVGRYVANNGVHEYISQGDVHQEFSLAGIAEYRRALAAQAVAKAKSEIAARGLVVTVVQTYYGLVVAQRKYATAQRAQSEAQRFFTISQKLETGGEVARADVIKAEVQFQEQERGLKEAELEMERSRLELAVLVFPDFNQNFAIVDDLQIPEPLPTFAEVQTAAA